MGLNLKFWQRKAATPEPEIPIDIGPVISVSDLPYGGGFGGGFRTVFDDGEKFTGGFGPTELLWTDYWSLHARSTQLFERNHYARGLVRRRVDNTIATGLNLEAIPDEKILGLSDEEKTAWSENVETRFQLWARTPALCDVNGRKTFGEIQADAFREADIDGDVLVTLQWNKATRLPMVALIKGSVVRTPLGQKPRSGHKIVEGVELDSSGRHVAYWVQQSDLSSKRLPAIGEKSGRRLAWLLYGGDRRVDDVRGKPMLSLCLQSLREIDRYRDSTQRKATINSSIAMTIERDVEGPAGRQISFAGNQGGAVRRGAIQVDAPSGETRKFRFEQGIPGMVLDQLQPGEKAKAFSSTGTDERFGDFEHNMLKSIAWSVGVSPEIYLMEFGKSFSASQAANNEFKIGLHRWRTDFGSAFCSPIYEEWLIAEVLNGKIEAPGFIEARRNPQQYDEYHAWLGADWAGQVKPAVDLSKLVTAYVTMINEGLITRDRAARELNGSKYDENVKRAPVESEKLADAMRVLVELKNAGKTPPQGPDESGDEGGDEPQRNQHSDDEEDEDEDNEAQQRRRLSVVG